MTTQAPRQMQPHWRDCLRVFPALTDPTFVNDTIRREHSPPITTLL